MGTLDHGLLNLPLNKRGGRSIEAEINAWKAGEASAAKVAARKLHGERQTARALLGAAVDTKLVSLAAKLNLTVKQTRAKLRGECVSSPALVIRFLLAA